MPIPNTMQPGVYQVDGKPVEFNPELYTFDDFTLNVTSGDTKALTADGNYEVVYERDIADGLGDIFGRGRNENPLQAQGFLGLRLVSDSAAAQATGSWRLALRTAQGRRIRNIAQGKLSDDDLFSGAAGSGTEVSRKDRSVFSQRNRQPITEPLIVSLDLDVASDITIDDAESETAMKMEGYLGEALQ